MITIKSSCVESFFNEFAKSYDDLTIYDYATLTEAKKVFGKYHYQGGNILDIACGTGLLSETLEGNFEYTGIDISSQMLQKASGRGYQIIKKTMEEALPSIGDQAYDFVVSFGALYYVEDVQPVIQQMKRIAKKAVFFDLCDLPDEFIQKCPLSVYNHSHLVIPDAIEDYFTFGWISPSQGVPINTRMILMSHT